MATTGMGAGEYWGRWHLQADRVHIEGTKRAGRVRDIPLVAAPAVPRMHRRTFEDGVRARSRDLTPYDLRRTYANWLEASGIPRTRRRLYLGHRRGRRDRPVRDARSDRVSRRRRAAPPHARSGRESREVPRFLPRAPSEKAAGL